VDQEPLVMDEIDAGAQFAWAFDQYLPVKVAFWLKAGDAGQRYLYIASDQINDDNFDHAYGEVLRIASRMPSIYLDAFQVKVINAATPLARAAAAINEQYPARIGTRVGGRMFGGMSIDSAYIYPSPLPASA